MKRISLETPDGQPIRFPVLVKLYVNTPAFEASPEHAEMQEKAKGMQQFQGLRQNARANFLTRTGIPLQAQIAEAIAYSGIAVVKDHSIHHPNRNVIDENGNEYDYMVVNVPSAHAMKVLKRQHGLIREMTTKVDSFFGQATAKRAPRRRVQAELAL